MTYVLMCTNVDDSKGLPYGSWETFPTASELRGILEDYYDDDVLDTAVDDLMSSSVHSMDDPSCTEFFITQIR